MQIWHKSCVARTGLTGQQEPVRDTHGSSLKWEPAQVSRRLHPHTQKTPRQRIKPGPAIGAKLSLLTLAQGGRCQGRRGDPELPKGTLQLHTPGGPSPSEWKRPLLQGPSSHQGGNPHS